MIGAEGTHRKAARWLVTAGLNERARKGYGNDSSEIGPCGGYVG